MKRKILFVTCLFTVLVSTAQDGPLPPERFEKVRDRITELVIRKLELTAAESNKFRPDFVSYLNALRTTNIDYRSDALVRQQKVAELRVQYRNVFEKNIGRPKAERVFLIEKQVQDRIREELRQRQHKRRGQPMPPPRNIR